MSTPQTSPFTHDDAKQAYMGAVNATATNLDKIIFIDPSIFTNDLKAIGIDYDSLTDQESFKNKIEELSEEQKISFKNTINKTLENNVEQQLPGSYKEMVDTWVSLNKPIENLAHVLLTGGPVTIDNIDINGSKNGLAVLPTPFYDTKEKIITNLLNGQFDNETTKTIIENSPGSDEDWIKMAGYHEGGHLDGKNALTRLSDEAKSDSVAMHEMTTKDLNPEVALAFKDIRSLIDNSEYNDYATSALLTSDHAESRDNASILHRAIGPNYKEEMLFRINRDFDFKAYKQAGGNRAVNDSDELLKEDPEIFFKAVDDNLKIEQANAIALYDANPTSYEAREAIISAQINADYSHSYEGAYSRKILGLLDFPEATPTQLIPQDVENDFYDLLKRKVTIAPLEEAHSKEALIEYDALTKSDWKSAYEKEQVSSHGALMQKNPVLYINTRKDYLERIKSEAQEQYEENPSNENLGTVIAVQYAYLKYGEQYNNNVESLTERLGEHTPSLEKMDLTSFVPEELKVSFYEDKQKQQEANSDQNLQTSASETGSPSIDPGKHAVIVDGKPITDYFAQQAEGTTSEPTPDIPAQLAERELVHSTNALG